MKDKSNCSDLYVRRFNNSTIRTLWLIYKKYKIKLETDKIIFIVNKSNILLNTFQHNNLPLGTSSREHVPLLKENTL